MLPVSSEFLRIDVDARRPHFALLGFRRALGGAGWGAGWAAVPEEATGSMFSQLNRLCDANVWGGRWEWPLGVALGSGSSFFTSAFLRRAFWFWFPVTSCEIRLALADAATTQRGASAWRVEQQMEACRQILVVSHNYSLHGTRDVTYAREESSPTAVCCSPECLH